MRRLLLALLSCALTAEAQTGEVQGSIVYATTPRQLIDALQTNNDHVVIRQHMDLTPFANETRFGVVTLHQKSIRVRLCCGEQSRSARHFIRA